MAGTMKGQQSESLPEIIKQGAFDAFKNKIEQVRELDQPMSNGYTPLIYSVKYNRREMVDYLLGKGAGIEQPVNGKTPLMYAAKYNRIDLLRFLLEKGAKVNHSTYKGNALYYATKYGREKVIEILQAQGAKMKGPGQNRKKDYSLNGADGPYIFYDDEKNSAGIISVGIDDKLKVQKKTKLSSVEVVVNKDVRFQVPLKSEIKKEEKSIWKNPQKIFAISDIEGNFKSFARLLQSNGVIDGQFGWCFGKGHLVLNGDFVDRGNQVTQVLWLIYKLEQEAKQQGGKVHFILGNHELMNLRGDLRYNADKYKALAQKLKHGQKGLFIKKTELGRWLRTKNIIEKVGSHLFVHGGISDSLLHAGLSIDQINTEARTLFHPAAINLSDNAKLIYGRFGPLWYRGMVRDYKYYSKLPGATVEQVLNAYNSENIIVGHNVVDAVSTDYTGKVVRIDVDHQKTPQALFIENSKMFSVNPDGKRTLL